MFISSNTTTASKKPQAMYLLLSCPEAVRFHNLKFGPPFFKTAFSLITQPFLPFVFNLQHKITLIMNVEDLVKHVTTCQNSLSRATSDPPTTPYQPIKTQSPADELDYFATEDEVLDKIKNSILWMSNQIDTNQPLDLSIPSPSSRSLIISTTQGNNNHTIILGPTQSTRTLSTSKPQKAARFARALAIMKTCHSILKAGCSISQRSLWYSLKTNPLFHSAPQVGEAIQDVISLLRVPRSSLGIVSSSKGMVAGNLIIQDSRSGQQVDCSPLPGASSSSSSSSSSTSGSWSIPGDLRALDYLSFDSNATAVLIIEKETIFQSLLQSKITQSLPCILITGRGYPDLSTRKFTRALVDTFPHLLTLALVDWNPSGLQICMMYKFGSKRMLESIRFAVPSVKWLGVRSDMLLAHVDDVGDGSVFQEMSSRDVALARNLCRELAGVEPAWVEELGHMLESESKAEMEALCSGNGNGGDMGSTLKDIFVDAIHQGNFI
jgi:meiotic recombination protein SPO11